MARHRATLVAGAQLTRSSRGRLAMQKGYGSAGAAKAATAVLGAVATGYAAYCGTRLGRLAEEARQRGEPVEVRDATVSTPATPHEIAVWQRRQRLTQYVVPALAGANIVLGSYLVQSYRTGATARGLLGRLLPG
ncbi:hypothetical protein ACIA5A_26535 [Micromonospora sp. NPDC051300]|uniref:hypothetical protein n=1 Tax=Micromonospora sp. NPDC051300 TaxID=3364286 RepID=UPI00379833D3